MVALTERRSHPGGCFRRGRFRAPDTLVLAIRLAEENAFTLFNRVDSREAANRTVKTAGCAMGGGTLGNGFGASCSFGALSTESMRPSRNRENEMMPRSL